MSVPYSYSSMTMAEFSLEVELMLFTPSRVLTESSMGSVTSSQTSSGPAPE